MMRRVAKWAGLTIGLLLLVIVAVIAYWALRPNRAQVDPALAAEVWPVVSDGLHNSNTHLIYWRDHFYLVHARSRFHMGNSDSRLVVRRSADGRSEVVLESPRKPMTIQDLLRHTSGLTYGAAGQNPLKQAYVDAKVGSPDDTNEQLVAKLSKLALTYQPGTTWEYSVSTDVLGRIVEVVSGLPLDRFIAERIAGPLKLTDTGFHAPPSKAERGA